MSTLVGWEISWTYSTKYIASRVSSKRITTLEDLASFVRRLLDEGDNDSESNPPDANSITIKPIFLESL